MKKIYYFLIIVFVSGIGLGVIFERFDYSLNSTLPKNEISISNSVPSLINIQTIDDVQILKNKLINQIWKSEINFLYEIPNEIQTDISYEKYSDLNFNKQIDKFTTIMKNDLKSYSYVFYPTQYNNELIIYHQGHDDNIEETKKFLNYFLEKNYTIVLFSMPLVGENSPTLIEIENIGNILFYSHNQFYLLESEDFSPILYFVEPIRLSLNYLNQENNFKKIHFVGISGGGWTSILYSAIDARIDNTISVAGSLPIFLRQESKNLGDYEQLTPSLYKIANYLDLYIMSSYGENRKLIQIFNKYDPCCFSGTLFEFYEESLSKYIENLGHGKFKIILDDTHKKHIISEYSLNLIYDEIKNSLS